MAYSDDLGVNWTLDATVDNGTFGINLGMQIHLDPTSQQPVVFGHDINSERMRFTRRISPGSWTAWADMGTTTINSTTQENVYFSGCVDSDGNYHVIAKDVGGTNNLIYITNASGSFTGSTVWTSAAGQDTPTACLASDSDGFVHLFYRYRDTSGTQHQFYRYVKKANADSYPELQTESYSLPIEDVQTIVGVTTSDSTRQYQIDIAIDDGGNAHLCWIQNNGTSTTGPEVYYGKKVAGAWTVELVELDNTRAHIAPTIAVNQNGDVFISWMEMTNTMIGDNEVVIAHRVSSWSVSSPFSVAGDDDCWPVLMHHQSPLLAVRPGISKVGYLGIYLDFDVGSGEADYKLFYSDDWEPYSIDDLVSEGPPSCEAEPDRASKVLTGEGTASLTYPQVPDLVFQETNRFDTRVVESDHGYQTTHPARATTRRMWTAQHRFITKTQRDTIVTFLDARQGPFEAFNFTLPEGGTVKVHFFPDTLKAEKVNPNVYNVTFQVEELF